MADIALARVCPVCSTLTTCSGSFTDPLLLGTCPRCSMAGSVSPIEIANPRFVHPAKAENDALKSKIQVHEMESENEQLRAKLKQLEPDTKVSNTATNPPPAIDEGKHSPELTNKYFDATGKVSNATPLGVSREQKKDDNG